MSALSNAHTHTCLCDGENTPAEMAEAALRLGFKSLGFSGHSFCAADGFGMDKAALAAYCREVEELKEKYRGRMAVYLGLELDSLSEFPPPCGARFDYLIGSVHNLTAADGRVWPLDESAEQTEALIAALGGAEAYIAAYFAAADEMLAMRRPTIAGHFDLLCKYNAGGRFFDEAAPFYRRQAQAVLRRHCREIVFEINTGAMFKGHLRRPYPDYWLWETLRDCDARVIVSSDAHSVRGLAFGLAEQRRRAQSFGLRVVDIDELC